MARIVWHRVTARISKQVCLRDIGLTMEVGEHWAILGANGLEKSALARQLRFSDLLDRGIRFLSTGEMRKVVICRALLHAPQLLVLDESVNA